jgi:hypothetical protein
MAELGHLARAIDKMTDKASLNAQISSDEVENFAVVPTAT